MEHLNVEQNNVPVEIKAENVRKNVTPARSAIITGLQQSHEKEEVDPFISMDLFILKPVFHNCIQTLF